MGAGSTLEVALNKTTRASTTILCPRPAHRPLSRLMTPAGRSQLVAAGGWPCFRCWPPPHSLRSAEAEKKPQGPAQEQTNFFFGKGKLHVFLANYFDFMT